MKDPFSIFLAAGGRAMSRDYWIFTLLFIAAILALFGLYSLYHGFYWTGGARGQSMRKIYRKDDPTKFALSHVFCFGLVSGLAALAYWMYTHFPETWRG